MRGKTFPLLIVTLFLLSQLVVLADKPAGVGRDKTFQAGNSHVSFVDGIKIKDPERKPGNGEPPAKGERGIIGQAGNSNNAFVELWSKDPDTWEVQADQAWGKLRYDIENAEFSYHFTGHMLEAETAYALIIYSDPWPGEGSTLLTTGMTDAYGDLLLKGSVDLAMGLTDAKVWLVYADDFDQDAGQMVAWNPDGYLFEYALITYTDTDA